MPEPQILVTPAVGPLMAGTPLVGRRLQHAKRIDNWRWLLLLEMMTPDIPLLPHEARADLTSMLLRDFPSSKWAWVTNPLVQACK